jgi:hypothetical protein
MEYIRVKNLRSIKDSGNIQIKPLTISVGSNSSGKSTLLRLFPLLRQSIATRTTGPILWNGDYVDFGSFEESLRRGSDSGSIDLTFGFEPERSDSRSFIEYLSRTAGLPKSYNIKIRTRIEPKGQKSASSLVSLSIDICNQAIVLNFGKRGILDSARINSRDIPDICEGLEYEESDSFLPTIQRKGKSRSPSSTSFVADSASKGPSHDKLHDLLDSLLHGSTSPSTINDLIERLVIGNNDRILQCMKNTRQDLSTWEDETRHMGFNNSVFKRIRDLVIATKIPILVRLSNEILSQFSLGVNYNAPVRARTERYYRKQNLAFDEVDPKGENLGIFLDNLTRHEKDDFDDWTSDLLGIIVKVGSQGGHLYISIDEDPDSQGDTQYNLVDAGFGFTQILPILTKLWSVTRERRGSYRRRQSTPTLCAMEQPELHLHPRLQAKVADILVASIHASRSQRGSPTPIVVETHSESIINRIGYLIQENKLNEKDVQVLLFERETPSLSNIASSEYDKEGIMKNRPMGFFNSDIRG